MYMIGLLIVFRPFRNIINNIIALVFEFHLHLIFFFTPPPIHKPLDVKLKRPFAIVQLVLMILTITIAFLLTLLVFLWGLFKWLMSDFSKQKMFKKKEKTTENTPPIISDFNETQ